MKQEYHVYLMSGAFSATKTFSAEASGPDEALTLALEAADAGKLGGVKREHITGARIANFKTFEVWERSVGGTPLFSSPEASKPKRKRKKA